MVAAGALWLTGWGIAVGQPSSPLRYWVPASFGAVAACAAGLIIILAVMYDWPGRWEKRAAPTAAAVTPESLATVSEPEATAIPGLPVDIRLKPERDMTTDRFRLGALNRGDLGSFRAEVIAIRTQDGWEPVVTQGGWPVPWLEDGSVTSTEILARYLDAYTAGQLSKPYMAMTLGELVVIDVASTVVPAQRSPR